jgi:hypothetical protein
MYSANISVIKSKRMRLAGLAAHTVERRGEVHTGFLEET